MSIVRGGDSLRGVIRVSSVLGFAFAGLFHVQAAGDHIAAFGRVSPGEGAITVALPYYQGAPQTVRELLVQTGDHVTKGQKLAVLQSQPLAAADLAVARTHLLTAQERLRALSAGPKGEDVAAQEATIQSLQAEAGAGKAGKNQEAALARVAAAQHQLAALRAVRPADLAIAQAEVNEAAASVARAETWLGAAAVEAPMEGQVLAILTRPGEGAAGRELLELGDTRAMVIKAEINAADAARVRPGALATIKSEAWAGKLTGTVARIDPRVSRSRLTALSTFANVDRQIVEATITPEAPEKLAALSGAEVTVLIADDAPAK